MRSLLIFLFILLQSVFFVSLDAQQEANSTKKQFKFYMNGSYSENKITEYLDQTYKRVDESKEFNFDGFSIAYEIDRGKFFSHEFELLPISIQVDDDKTSLIGDDVQERDEVSTGGKETSLKSVIGYQMNHSFLNNKILEPYIGFSTHLFFEYYNSSPHTSRSFNRNELNLGTIFSLPLGLKVHISKKIAFDLNIPFRFYEIKWKREANDNPQIPIANQVNSNIIGDFLPEGFSFRFGIAYKL